MDIERLKTDPAYWDEHAPEGAEVYIIDADGVTGPAFYYHNGRVWQGCHSDAGFWMAIDHDYLDVIPRPTQPQWRGPEDGLPPVGTVCEAKYAEEWHRCTVVAHLKDHRGMTDAVFQAEDDWDFHQRPEMFRPLKSDKERAIDAAVAATVLKDGPRIRSALSDIYDAGLLKMPEDTQ